MVELLLNSNHADRYGQEIVENHISVYKKGAALIAAN